MSFSLPFLLSQSFLLSTHPHTHTHILACTHAHTHTQHTHTHTQRYASSLRQLKKHALVLSFPPTITSRLAGRLQQVSSPLLSAHSRHSHWLYHWLFVCGFAIGPLPLVLCHWSSVIGPLSLVLCHWLSVCGSAIGPLPFSVALPLVFCLSVCGARLPRRSACLLPCRPWWLCVRRVTTTSGPVSIPCRWVCVCDPLCAWQDPYGSGKLTDTSHVVQSYNTMNLLWWSTRLHTETMKGGKEP